MITIDYKDRKPIYEQLMDNIKTLIIRGALLRDDQLPSVRQLANELAINPNTIQKAYSELERQGITYSLKGRGSFVASNLVELRSSQKQLLFGELATISHELIQLEVPEDEVKDKIGEFYQGNKGGELDD